MPDLVVLEAVGQPTCFHYTFTGLPGYIPGDRMIFPNNRVTVPRAYADTMLNAQNNVPQRWREVVDYNSAPFPPPAWPLSGAVAGSPIVFDFMGGVLPGGVLLTRATVGSYFNNTPAFASAAINAARFTYDDSGLRGLLVEPAAQNEVRNSDASAGLVPGSPGTFPTSWSGTTAPAGLTRTLSGGVEDGMNYVDIRLAGTTIAPFTAMNVSFDATRPASVVGDVWYISNYGRLLAGAVGPIIPPAFQFIEFDGASATIIQPMGASIKLPVGGSLRNSRYRENYTMVSPNAASFRHTLILNFRQGETVDFTMRFAQPQMIKAKMGSSPVVTTGVAAVLRAADIATVPLANGKYSIDVRRHSGTTTYQFQNVTGGTWTIPPDGSAVQRITANLQVP